MLMVNYCENLVSILRSQVYKCLSKHGSSFTVQHIELRKLNNSLEKDLSDSKTICLKGFFFGGGGGGLCLKNESSLIKLNL